MGKIAIVLCRGRVLFRVLVAAQIVVMRRQMVVVRRGVVMGDSLVMLRRR